MSEVSTPTMQTQGGPPLGGGRLTAFEASGVSVAGLAPTMAMALGTAFAASEAGDAVPLSYLFALIGSLALAYVIVRFARRRPGSGLAFTYVDNAFGKTPGFTAGAIYSLSWLFGVAVTLAISAVAISSIVSEYHGSVSWFPLFLAEMAIALALNYIGVKPSVRLQVLAELGSMLAVTAIFGAALASPHSPGLSFRPFEPSVSLKGWGGIGFGMIYGFSGFAGFEGAAALGFETRNPRSGIPRAILWSLIGAGIFYLFVTYALAIGFGPHGGSTWASSPAPLAVILTKYMGPNWATSVEAMVALSGFSAGLGLVTLSTRVLHGMSLRGVMPRALRYEHPRFRTPSYSVVFVCAVAAILGAALGLSQGTTTLIGFTAGFNTLILILVYAAIAAGAFVVFGLRESGKERWHAFVVPVIAFGLLAYAFYASVIPVPAFPYNLAPYLVLGVTIVFAIVGLRVRTKPDVDFSTLVAEPARQTVESPQQGPTLRAGASS